MAAVSEATASGSPAHAGITAYRRPAHSDFIRELCPGVGSQGHSADEIVTVRSDVVDHLDHLGHRRTHDVRCHQSDAPGLCGRSEAAFHELRGRSRAVQ